MSKYGYIFDLEDKNKTSSSSRYGHIFSSTAQLNEADNQLEALFGETVEPEPKKEYPLLQKAIGAGENILSLITGATTGAVGHAAGTVAGIPKAIMDGDYGTTQGTQTAADAANSVAGLLTYQPRTEAGKEYQQGIGDVYNTYGAPLEALAGLGAPTPLMNPMVGMRARRAQIANDKSVGAAEAEAGAITAANAESLPIPFEGDAALSQGQRTRDYEQLQFENEQAKIGPTGEPIRNQRSAQADVFERNLSDIQDSVSGGVRYGSDYDQGQAVSAAVNAQKTQDWSDVGRAYDAARAAQELDVPVVVNALPEAFQKIQTVRHISPEVDGIFKAAQELGIIDADGVFNPRASVDSYIKLRETITQAMPSSRAGRLVSKNITDGIDADLSATTSGPLFKEAQKQASQFYRTYDENSVVNKVSDGAAERIYQAIKSGDVDKITALRNNMYRSEDGIREWKGIQGRFIKDLMKNVFDTNQRDVNGRPIIKPAAINKWVTELEQNGKMDLLFDKQTQEQLFTLRDLAQDMFTAPQGSVNWSNTSSAIMSTMAVLTDVALFAGTGVPAPLAITGKVLARNRKDNKLQKRIKESLNPEGNK